MVQYYFVIVLVEVGKVNKSSLIQFNR